MPAYDRMDRISEEVRRELDRIVRQDVRDPRVSGTFSITRADVTRDFRYCNMRVSVLEADKRAPMLAALKSAAGFLRRALGQNMDLRYTPELLFEIDTNIEYAAHIDALLRQGPVGARAGAPEDGDDEDGEDGDEGDV